MEGIHVGTSGWTYDDWEGSFYPEGVKGAERLSFYASRFDTVEVNASFYRFPTEPMIGAWNRRLPPGFHLALKGHRQITHRDKLLHGHDVLEAFLDRVSKLRSLRVLLWQLPPSLHFDIPRLEKFLEHLQHWAQPKNQPSLLRHAVEFRHESWWNEATAAVLRKFNAAFVAISHPHLPENVIPTADFLYLRFHGKGRQLYNYDYSDAELSAWRQNLAPHLPHRSLFAFFNNDWNANAPRNAARFRVLF